jgi:hypothetical protein
VAFSKFKTTVFTFSRSAAELIRKAAKAQLDVELQLFQQGLEKDGPMAQRPEAQGLEAILSRRGTSVLLRENLKIPIISFPLISIDILTAIQRAAKYGNKVLFPVFR